MSVAQPRTVAAASAPPAANQVVLTACVVELAALRYTPAAVPALDMMLEHHSSQHEMAEQQASARTVRLQLQAVALGVLAERLAALPLGQMLQLRGFLAPLRASSRPGRSLRLHIQHFEVIAALAPPQVQTSLVQ